MNDQSARDRSARERADKDRADKLRLEQARAERRSTFPLPLSSVTGERRQDGKVTPATVATPQTATRNAAHNIRPGTGAGTAAASNFFKPGAGQGVPARPMPAPAYGTAHAPTYAPAYAPAYATPAQARAQTGPALIVRPDHGVSDSVRRAMVARVARQGVTDQVVLDALAAVPRHHFIEPALSAQAYVDASLPIGHNQTISQPYIVARMIEVMRNGGPLGHVLEIGTGCGYQAAVLSCVAREVFSSERIKPLHELA